MRARASDALLRRLQRRHPSLRADRKYFLAYAGGKTYTMGTSHGYAACDNDLGILPRVINSLFQEIQKRQTQTQFTVRASFL